VFHAAEAYIFEQTGKIAKTHPDYAAFSADRGGVQVGNFGVVAKG
jgi:hypothetical protein